ncbi:MAG: hypothetical protein CMM01_16605 [Rhodopirellula sp.]|nr:hypothetical protein [Rhodopirellula sp.]MAI72509.1 hypothetical protein [Rhodopirellula sp.]OUX50285.1 MAG: hypothetical protein CBE43_07635 [Rhodopirellula sp. TMED283]
MIRAEVELSFFRRFLWIAIACLAGTGWCLLDAQVTYPRKREIAQSYESFPQTAEGIQQWEKEAEKNGWIPDAPEKSSRELEVSILNQYILMAASISVGLVMFFKWYLPRGSWIEGTEDEIRDSSGRTFALTSLVEIDRHRWEEKGIAVLRFNHEGRNQKFVLDDFKYQREATGKILEQAEKKLESLIREVQPKTEKVV